MSESPPPPPRKLQIRKYPNRRYYDSTRSRHVTLEEIHAAIREGCDIEVTDSRTGQDITGKVLAQIILELDPPKLDVFPAPLLHKLLRSSEKLVTDFVQKYFNEALDSFLDSQRNMEQAMRSAMGLPAGAPTLADVTKMFWSPLKSAPWSVPGTASAPDASSPSPAASGSPSPPRAAPSANSEEQDLRAMVEQLRREIEHLRQARKKTAARKRPRRKP